MKKAIYAFGLCGIFSIMVAADRPRALAPQSSGFAAVNPFLSVRASQAPDLAKPAAIRDFGKVPVYFIPNAGQIDGPVAFYVDGSDKSVYFTPKGVTFALRYGGEAGNTEPLTKTVREPGPAVRENEGPAATKRWVVRMDFLGANPDVRPQGADETGAHISYFRGPRERWKAALPAYSKIIYKDLWPGIDLIYKGRQDKLKYEFIVHPGADPATIRLAWSGAEKIRVDGNGRLEIVTSAGSFVDEAPSAFQDIKGRREIVDMSYDLHESPSHSLGFAVGSYDRTRDLILDPIHIVYCGYIGGSENEYAHGIAVDGSGNAYVAGYTKSSQSTFPETV